MNIPILIYCYDAYCGWCYGFSKTISEVETYYNQNIQFETLSGGMVTPKTPTHISVTANYILQAIPKVTATTGVKFGSDFIWHLENPTQTDWFPDSTKPSIAACIIKEKNPLLQIKFIEALQFGLFVEGRDLTDDEAYRHLLPLFNFESEEFYLKLKDEKYKKMALNEFDMCEKLQVKGFPAIYLQHNNKIYTVANGFTNKEVIIERINKII